MSSFQQHVPRPQGARELGLPDASPEPALDRLTRVAAIAVNAPICLVSLVDADRQFIKSAYGPHGASVEAHGTTIAETFCRRIIAGGQPLVIEDLHEHPSAQESPAMPEAGFRACLGVPLTLADGQILGAFCVIDTQPHRWPAGAVELMRDLADLAVIELERRFDGRTRDEITGSEPAELAAKKAALEARIAEAGETESKLRALVEHAADAFLVHDAHGRIIDTNQSASTVLGYTRAELLERTVHDLGAGAEWTGLKPGQGTTARVLYRRKNGSTVPLEVRRSCCEIGGQRLFLILARDLTQSLTAEEGLRQQAMLIHLAHDPIFVWDVANGILFWNKGSESLYEFTKEEAVGRSSHALLKTAFPVTREEFETELERHGRWSGEMRQCTRSGRQVTVSSRVQKVTVGGRTLMLEANRDITALRRAMEQVELSERRFHQLVQIAPVGVFETDANGDCLYVNQRWCDIAGMPLEQALGKGWASALYPEDRERVSAQWYRAVAGRMPFQAEYRYQRPDGVVRWALCNGIPQHAADGSLLGFMGTVTDISDNKDVELELRRSREQLRTLLGRLDEAVEEERRHLAREVHDQLGQALTALKLDASWAAQRLAGDDQTVRAVVADKLKGMAGLIDMTVDSVQRISAQLRPQMLEDMGLVPALEVHAEQFAERTGIRSHVHAGEDPALPAPAATHVFRIVQEAMTNVARHAGAARVDVSLIEVDRVLHVEIQDDGRGITEAEQHSVTSLGMLGMRERARLLGGRLTVTGAPGRGTVVTLEVAIDAESAAS